MSLNSPVPAAGTAPPGGAVPVSRPEASAEPYATARRGVAVSLAGGGYRAMRFHLGQPARHRHDLTSLCFGARRGRRGGRRPPERQALQQHTENDDNQIRDVAASGEE